MKREVWYCAKALSFVFLGAAQAADIGNAFTYQGRLGLRVNRQVESD